MKNYVGKINFDLAGLDLILDKNGRIWFIEANSFPGFFEEHVKKRKELLKEVLGKKLVAFIPEERKLRDSFVELLESLTNFEVVYVQGDQLPEVVSDSEIIKVLSWKSGWKPVLAKKNYVINSPEISLITSDKYKTYKLINRAKIKTPKTFLVKSFDEIAEVFKKLNCEKLILKPRFGCRGENIEIVRKDNFKNKEINFQEIEYIIQEFIETENENHLFCDYRILVAGGRYIGAIKRESLKPVVSICLGGIVREVSDELDQKFAPIAEKIVKTLISGCL
jgi:glutathione synthase/RimK-type ligase-like ATP-grasp enzyme